MYSTLNLYGQSCSANNRHFPCPSMPLPTYHVDEKVPPPPLLTPDSDKKFSSLKVLFDLQPKVISERTPIDYDGKKKIELLPVMDPRFNLREICKQCVLLEDHLTHDDKRCSDCSIKHFLALEGLAEEALTLDKEGILCENAKDLPRRIRELQIFWMKNPNKCHEVSQRLREIRKKFQQSTFSIIENGCDGNVCKVNV